MKTDKKNFVFDMQVTGKCNMNCDFCCGAIRDNREESLDTMISVIDKLKMVGTSAIVFSGGEPLLRKDIAELLKYAHENKFVTYLSTNGKLFFEKYPSIREYIDCLGLPLDGSSEEINVRVGRSKGTFSTNLDILRYLAKYPKLHKLKVGTLVSKMNYNDIANVGKLLSEEGLCKPDVWRLYQFTPIRRGEIFRDKHEISNSDFYKLCETIKKLYPGLNISELSNESSDDSYFFIDPRMHLQILRNNQFLDRGNVNEMDVKQLEIVLQEYKGLKDKNVKNRRWLYE